jgi:hypothetical protein
MVAQKAPQTDHAFSSTYQQTSDERADFTEKDAANTLLWRMNRRRLEFEPFRDTLLAVADKLDLKERRTPGGDRNRTLRSAPHHLRLRRAPESSGYFPDVRFREPGHHESATVQYHRAATGALHDQFALCHSAGAKFCETARSHTSSGTCAQKWTALYEAALLRKPTEEEIKLSEDFVASQQAIPAPEAPVSMYGNTATARSMGSTLKLASFTPLPRSPGKSWKADDKMPDSKLSGH